MWVRASSNLEPCAKTDPDVSQNASDADKSAPNVRRFMFCNGSGYRNPRRRMAGSASGQPPWRRTCEIGKTHQRTQGPITGKPKKRAGREWYNPIIKNRTQMNADYLGKNEPVNPRKSVSRQKTENRAMRISNKECRNSKGKTENFIESSKARKNTNRSLPTAHFLNGAVEWLMTHQ